MDVITVALLLLIVGAALAALGALAAVVHEIRHRIHNRLQLRNHALDRHRDQRVRQEPRHA